jgi:hypothetical protein
MSARSVRFLKQLLEMIQQFSKRVNCRALRVPEQFSAATNVVQGRYFSRHVPKVFKEKILSLPKFQQKAFEIRTSSDHVCRLFIVSPGTTKPAAFFKDAARKVYTWLTLCRHFAPAECSRHLDVYLYLLNDKKILPSGPGLDVEQVNTAFTIRGCDNVSEINIFREEEWFKVLIHETFHNHGLDFSIHFDAYDALVQGELQRSFPALHSKVLLFESYCEFWAETLHTLFLAATFSDAWAKARKLFRQERDFSALQCVKVLDHYGLQYDDLLKKNGAVGFVDDKTNVFAYHVIKFIMVEADFLDWHLAVHGPTLRFSDDHVLGFCKWIYANRKVPDLIDTERFYATLDKREQLAQTLRMVANN